MPKDETPAITEKQFTRQVRELAELFGWRFYHPWLSIHSPRGWPDCALVRGQRLVLAELKTDKGKLTPSQEEWIAALKPLAGLWTDPDGVLPGIQIDVVVWRPRDFDVITATLR